MNKVNFKKFRKSVILMIVAVSLMSVYIAGFKGLNDFLYFLTIIPVNVARLIFGKLNQKDNWIKETYFEKFLRAIAALIQAFIPIFLIQTGDPNLVTIGYIFICAVASGITTLYSEVIKSGLIYIGILASPTLLYGAINGNGETRVIVGFLCIYFLGLLSNFKEMNNVAKNLYRKTRMLKEKSHEQEVILKQSRFGLWKFNTANEKFALNEGVKELLNTDHDSVSYDYFCSFFRDEDILKFQDHFHKYLNQLTPFEAKLT